MRFLPLLVCLFLVTPLQAQVKGPPPVKITLPPDIPAQQPAVVTPTVLTPDLLYMIWFDKALIVRSSPGGLVTVTQDTGPLRVRGVFINGTGKFETRDFPAGFIYTVTPVGTGAVELNISLAGATDASADIVRALSAQTNAPPPGPPTPPAPSALTATLKAAIVADNVPLSTAATLATVYRKIASTTVQDPTITTFAKLAIAAKQLQDAAVPTTTIPNLKAAVGAFLIAAFPADGNTPLDQTAAANAFKTLATALEAIK